ncbi:GspH/FimT family pseudopilin [Microbulbifer sp. OS29]|uniref:Type II secretion system protein H n=1 Tax=Microbulbifer okhotskensis TaxID=2926617 RepID=A0A9X2J548_9GAMM|nr:GspH/FimT family pseudopilin [Microbulbifer okhotskensis]MCO1334828.1 GspH/FimT family pseudopilin [Microbulbifer okhotskensis]
MKNIEYARGLTLIELMIAIALLGIIIAIGVPSFSSLIDSNRLATTTNDWIATLQYARSEAVRSRKVVTLSALDDDISNGIRVWVDTGNNSFDADEELRVLEIDFADVALTAQQGDTFVSDVDFSFNAVGETSVGDTLTLNLCDSREGDVGRQIELFESGIVRLTPNIACNVAEDPAAVVEGDE